MTDRELDALVAEKVMGWHPHLCDGRFEAVKIPHYSTSWASMGLVVEKMRGLGGEDWEFTLSTDGSDWEATFWMGDAFHDSCERAAPRAVCMAALKAMGVEI